MFTDRKMAGLQLAAELKQLNIPHDQGVILGIPRGGMDVAAAISREIHLPLDVVVAKKIGAPNNPELAVGAVSSYGQVVIADWAYKHWSHIDTYIEEQKEPLIEICRQKEATFRLDSPVPMIQDKIVVIVDDGIATGMTALAAIEGVRSKGARQIIIAAPVIAQQSVDLFKGKVDAIVAVETPENLQSISQYYQDFEQVSDRRVQELMGLYI